MNIRDATSLLMAPGPPAVRDRLSVDVDHPPHGGYGSGDHVVCKNRMVTVLVGLLRGVNVGKHNRVGMAQLRAIAEECGCTDVITYIQSGNLVFAYDGEDPARTLETHILDATGITTSVIIRTAGEVAAIVDANPFLDRSDDPTHHHVACAETDLAGALDGLDLDSYHPESAFVSGRELHLYLPGGMAASRLTVDLARRPGAVGTTRNWRTMTKLAELSAAHPGQAVAPGEGQS